jgi:NAD(P)-dependent dehydrogenase (short-subunit alcohol dehydrogenase family)
MAASKIDVATVQQATPPIPVPSQWWCRWQTLKGTNPRRLKTPDADLRNKWILLTGGNSGVGFEAAAQFVKWGANIVLGCRPQVPPHEMHPYEAIQQLKAASIAAGHPKAEIEWWECDMSSLKSVEAFGKRWVSTGRSLDILANNAGIGRPPVPGEVCYTADGFEIVHQVRIISIFVDIAASNYSLGELHFSRSPQHDLTSILSTGFAAAYYLYNVMHAILWCFRLGKRKFRQKRICE